MFLKTKKRLRIKSVDLAQLEDEDLIRLYKRSNNPDIIGELFQRYTHLVFGICIKYLHNEEKSKDAVMQIFEKLLDNLLEHHIENFKSWLYSVAKNYCLMEIRKEKSRKETLEKTKEKVHENFMENEPEIHLIFEKDFENEKKLNNLHLAIKKLNTAQKACIELVYLQNKSYQEVSDITGYTIKQVKSYVQNGKRNLKNYLNG